MNEQVGAWQAHLLLLSEHNREAIIHWSERLASLLEHHPKLDVADICATLNCAFNHYACRIPLIFKSREELIHALRSSAKYRPNEVSKPMPVGLMFSGKGAQYPGMAANLFERWPRFRRAMKDAEKAFAPWLKNHLLACIYHPVADVDQLARADLSLPAMFAIDYSLGRSLLELGVKPAALIGHGVGEYVAACLAGCLDLSEAARVVSAQGQLISELPEQGGMMTVFSDVDKLSNRLEEFRGRLWFAANNGSHQVVAGYNDALAELTGTLEAEGIHTKRLRVANACHTPLLEPIIESFDQILQEVQWQEPKLPMISNVTGDWFGAKGPDTDYWLRQILNPVRFEQGIRTAFAGGIGAFVECGPDRALTNLVSSIPSEKDVILTSLIDRRRNNARTVLEALGTLYGAGVIFDIDALREDFPGKRLPLITNFFARIT